MCQIDLQTLTEDNEVHFINNIILELSLNINLYLI